jgi:hypothetical protein
MLLRSLAGLHCDHQEEADLVTVDELLNDGVNKEGTRGMTSRLYRNIKF